MLLAFRVVIHSTYEVMYRGRDTNEDIFHPPVNTKGQNWRTYTKTEKKSKGQKKGRNSLDEM